MLESLMEELLDECEFDDPEFEWNQKRQTKFKETEDGRDAEAFCDKPEALFEDVEDSAKEKKRCDPCQNTYIKQLTVEFYTNQRPEKDRLWIQKSKAQFIPKTDHYWKIFVPQLLPNNAEGEPISYEKREDFPVVCERVKAPAGERIDIDPPDEPGHFIIMNCAHPHNFANLGGYDNATGKYHGCGEKKNFPPILQNL